MKKQTKAVIAILSGMALITGCSDATQVTAASEQTYTPVVVTTTETSTIKEVVSFSSKATPINEIDIYGNYAGDINEVYFNIGDTVDAGDVLFSFDKDDMQNNVDVLSSQLVSAESVVNSASLNVSISSGSGQTSQLLQMESALTNAKIAYENAEKSFNNSTALLAEGFISQVEFDNINQGYISAKTNYETTRSSYDLLVNKQLSEGVLLAKNQLNQAEASRDALTVQYNNALDSLNDLDVTSPISGIVATKTIEANEYYASSFPAYSIINIDTIKLTINVPESIINTIDKSDAVEVTFDTIPDKIFEGIIYEVSPVPNPQDLTYPVNIHIDNGNHLIKSGMFADVTMVKEQADNVVVVNRNDLEFDNGLWFAYTVADDIVAVNEVQIGLDNGINVEVTSGLEAGQQLITSGKEYVSDGEQVTTLKAGGE